MYYFLVNPSSRSHKGMKSWNEIEKYLLKEKVDFKVYFSKRSGHMQQLMYSVCNEHLNDTERTNIVILGGDGTYNEAVQGIIAFDKVNIGYIPTGSGNDFAKAIGSYDDPIENVKRVLACTEPKKYDIGKLKLESFSDARSRRSSDVVAATRYFNVSCGIGFDAAVCEEALASRGKDVLNKIGLGKLAYGIIAIRQIFGAKLTDAILTMDDNKVVQIKNCRFIVGMNTCYEGGGFKFAPDALPDDGYLDICTVGNISPLGVILALPLGMKGTHTKLKKIHTYHVKSFEVKTREPLWVHTDGEVEVKADRIRVSLIPGGLNFLW